jgi:hypothetical protein
MLVLVFPLVLKGVAAALKEEVVAPALLLADKLKELPACPCAVKGMAEAESALLAEAGGVSFFEPLPPLALK